MTCKLFASPSFKLQYLDRSYMYKERLPVWSFARGCLPPSVYLSRHLHDKMDTRPSALPLRFCTLQTIKNRTTSGRTGNEASGMGLRSWLLVHVYLREYLLEPLGTHTINKPWTTYVIIAQNTKVNGWGTLTLDIAYMQKLAVGDRMPSATALTYFTELDHLLLTHCQCLTFLETGGRWSSLID